MIPDEAIEAAAEALVSSTLGDRRGINWEEFFEAARLALESAAPYMHPTSPDAGMAEWENCPKRHGSHGQHLLDCGPNPYRSQA